MLQARTIPPYRDTRPKVGRSALKPHRRAGEVIDPWVSDPMPKATQPAAVADAGPADEPLLDLYFTGHGPLIALASACTDPAQDRGGDAVMGELQSAPAEPAPAARHRPPPWPPAGADKAEAKLSFAASDLRGEAVYHMAEREVTVVWLVTYTPGAPNDPHRSVQTEPTAFWPTEAYWMSAIAPRAMMTPKMNTRRSSV